jgi:hypothetical protein
MGLETKNYCAGEGRQQFNRDGRWPLKFRENPHTLPDISILNLIIVRRPKEQKLRVFTVGLLPCTRNKIYITKLVTWDVIFSSVAISKVSLTRPLDPRAAVVRKKRKSLWALCISHM